MNSFGMKPRSRFRRAPWVLALLVLGGVAWWALGDEKDSEEKLRTVKVETGTVEDTVTAQGKLEPKDYVDVGLQVSGQIKKIHVEIGDVVKQGQLLVEIDPRIYTARVEANQAQLKALRAQTQEQQAAAELAQQQYLRSETLFKQNAISKDAMQQSEAALKAANAKLTSLRAQAEQVASALEQEKTNLGFTKIYAPMDGVVTTLPVREGQTLNSVQSAPTLMQLANLDVMTVRAQVAEADIPRITPDMAASFSTLGNMERRWVGTIRLIQPSPEIISDVVLYNVLIDVENTDRQLMTGMSTQVFFDLGKTENVLVIPLEALGKRMAEQDNESGKAYQVRVLAGGKPEPKTVHIGMTDRTQAEVKSGLSAGDTLVITAPVKTTTTRGGGMPSRGPRL